MSRPALASTNAASNQQQTLGEDPFAASAADTPSLPQPCARAIRSIPTSPVPAHRIASPRHSSQPECSTVSQPQLGGRFVASPAIAASKHNRTASQQEKMRQWPSREHTERVYITDPEKASYDSRQHSHNSSNSTIMTSIAYDDNEEINEERLLQEKKTSRILLFMSGPCVALSLLNTVWTVLALLITLLSQPLRLGGNRPTFSQQLTGFLGPALRLQLRCIHTLLPANRTDDDTYSAFKLVLVHTLSPFLSFAMMFAAWTLAVYWVSSAVVGDPAGQDKRDDGKETVLGLRNWWERWLMWSFRDGW